MKHSLAVSALILVACGSAEPTSSALTDPTREPTSHVEGAPPDVDAIAALLRARHDEDLPDADALRRHPEPEAALVWLAANGEPFVVRVRALAAMASFEGDAIRQTLLAVLSDDAMHPALRAAAATGSQGLELDAELEGALERAARTGDPRVVRAVEARRASR